ncbi:MAG: N-6 DNA methylase [Polyangiaceae bacterium]
MLRAADAKSNKRPRRSEALRALSALLTSPATPEALSALRTVVVATAARAWAAAHGLSPDLLARTRLACRERDAQIQLALEPSRVFPVVDQLLGDLRDAPLEALGGVLERTLDLRATADGLDWVRGRKGSGSFFTPTTWTEHVTRAALDGLGASSPKILDPAVGAGAFLLAAARLLHAGGRDLREILQQQLFGVDRSVLAIATAEASLILLAGDDAALPALERHLVVGNSLVEPGDVEPGDVEPGDAAVLDDQPLSITHTFKDVFTKAPGFDLVLGNPPWVAFAGRAAKPLSPELRKYFATRYRAFRGYPTLHAMFVERAAELAPAGRVALLLPSPLADLDGYKPARRALATTHSVREPLLELGQDAFEGVTQPCFLLLADAGADAARGDAPWILRERSRARVHAKTLAPPAALVRLGQHPRLPQSLFGEMGFQSSGDVSKRLLLRASTPNDGHTYPLLEGRNVHEFREDPPRLFLKPDADVLVRARCRLRPQADYHRARFVVRQTAAYPIAALHAGLPFRNSLIAGFDDDVFAPEVIVALLNSSLYRALHLSLQRDARQAAFPQLKVGHLRRLPAPDPNHACFAKLAGFTAQLTGRGVDAPHRKALDDAVFELFAFDSTDRAATLAFLHERAPKLARD